jgi:hypothetical protein
MTATGTSFTPTGSVAAANVQAAIEELDAEKAALSGAIFTGGVSAQGGFFAKTAGQGYLFDGDTDTGMVNPGNGQLSFIVDGQETVRMTAGNFRFGGVAGSTYWTAQSDGNLIGNVGDIALLSANAVGVNGAAVAFHAPAFGLVGTIRGVHVPSQYTQVTINSQAQSFGFRNDGNAYAPGSWVPGSDARWKDNIQPIGNALAKLSQISGNTYTRNDLDNRPMAGIIAQELQMVLPEGVTQVNSEGFLGVDPMAAVALLVQAVKELKSEVDDLRSQLVAR